MSKQVDGGKWMQTYPLQFTEVRYTAVWSLLLTLLLIGLFASLSLAGPVMAAPAPTRELAAQVITSAVTPTYAITGQVRPVGGFPLAGVVIYAGSQYSTTLDAAGFYTLTGVLSGAYTIRGELVSPSPCVAYLFEPITRSVQTPPSIGGQDFKVFQGHADPAPVQGRVTDSNGAPIAGVSIGGIGAVTDAAGWFESGEMSGCDSYTLTPQKLGFTFAPPTLTVTQPNVGGIWFVGTDHFQYTYLPLVASTR